VRSNAPGIPGEGRALRTETTINDSMDFAIRKGLGNLPALREIGLRANRRLLGVQRLDHDPITGTRDLHTITDPVVTDSGTRIPGLRMGQQRSHALLAALLKFRLQPDGFTNQDLRSLTAELRGLPAEAVTAGQMTYDLRRLRSHGLIGKIPHTHRYQLIDHGLSTAMFLTRVHDRLLPTGLAVLADTQSPRPLRAAATAYQSASTNSSKQPVSQHEHRNATRTSRNLTQNCGFAASSLLVVFYRPNSHRAYRH
jgi:hypothetical protein